MQNNFNNSYTNSNLWHKRPFSSRVDDYDTDDSSTSGSPWRAMKRLRVEGPQRDEPRLPEQTQNPPQLECMASRSESMTSNNDDDYAIFNKMLGSLHLERRSRQVEARTPPRRPIDASLTNARFQESMAAGPMDSPPPNKGRTRRNQTKLKTSSKLA